MPSSWSRIGSMARQFRIEYSGCTWAAGRVLAPRFRLGEDQMIADECAKLRFDPFDVPYLEQIARALGQAEQRPILPTKEEIASWSMLHPDEIETARKNESKPWPQHEPKWFQFGQNEAVPNVRMPVVIDFRTNGISLKNIFLNHMTVLDRNDSAVTLLHEGNQDSGIEINTQKIPMAQIKSIQIEAALTGDSSPEQLQGEFFWSTSY